MEFDDLLKNFTLLKKIVNPVNSLEGKVDLTEVEKIIFNRLPEELEENAPANFPQLYFDFKQEYERFKQFILYDKLIGKNIVALGGGFSTGKSSFLNSLLGKRILPSNINPSTSVPSYLVNGKESSVLGINTFGSQLMMEIEDVKAISHGFGKIDEADTEATLGHIVDSLFISSQEQQFENIAFLDTPGYSKADSADYSAKTDENIARVQLNSSNYILWFVQADSGTISNEDIEFLNTLNKDILRLFIVNKVDKVTAEDLKDVVKNIRNILDVKGISYVDVMTYSQKKGVDCDREKIISQLQEWNQAVYESRFAYNFKVLFTKCKEYYDAQIDVEEKRLNRLNKASTHAETDIVRECLGSLTKETQRNISALKEFRENLKTLQTEFFTEIKRIGDTVHIEMPEPTEIDLIRDKIVNPKEVLDLYCEKQGIKEKKDYQILLTDTFAGIESVFNRMEGNADYAKELSDLIEENLNLESAEIRFQFIVDAKELTGIIQEKTFLQSSTNRFHYSGDEKEETASEMMEVLLEKH